MIRSVVLADEFGSIDFCIYLYSFFVRFNNFLVQTKSEFEDFFFFFFILHFHSVRFRIFSRTVRDPYCFRSLEFAFFQLQTKIRNSPSEQFLNVKATARRREREGEREKEKKKQIFRASKMHTKSNWIFNDF